jgi:nicotinamide mononucleotide transporter
MCTFQTRWNYPIGIVTTAAYSYLYLYVWDLPNLGYFNLYLVFSLTYGFFRWKSDADTRPVEHITGYWWLGYVGLGVAVYGLLYTINAVLQKEMTFMDTATAVLSGVAQFGLDNKKLQNWILWIVVDVISLYLYYTQNLPFVFIQYVFFTANAVWAYYVWKQGMTSVTTTATRPVVSLTLDGETVQY